MTDSKIEVKGLSQFFYWSIPAVLGLAAVVWLGFWLAARDAHRQSVQEDRHAEIVGAKPLPKEPIKFELRNRKSECIQIDRAEIDGGEMWLYYHNGCDQRRSYIKFSWSYAAPDGTIVGGGERYSERGDGGGPSELMEGEHAEFRETIKDDPRGQTLRLSVHSENY